MKQVLPVFCRPTSGMRTRRCGGALAALAEARDAIEEVIEPFLVREGFVMRTPRGRVACPRAYEHMGLTPPASGPQAGLFGEK